MTPSHFFRLFCSAAALAASLSAFAQGARTLPAVTVTGRADPPLAIGGFDDVPLERTPLQASIVGSERMRDAGVSRLADLARIDPAVGDAYNAEGYWDSLTVRGFVVDNRFNYRRDGLPINAETSIAIDNKERLELLKGLSGLQAGTSAPGGLVNLVVKRPLATNQRSAVVGWRESGSLLGAVDLSQRLGDAVGVRVNAAYEHLDPPQRSARGHRHLLALAGDVQASRNLLIEAEFETSHRSQPSVPGFSLLGDTVPDPRRVDPRINLNNQPWTQPVLLDGDTASMRVTQRLETDWTLGVHLATQRLRSDDRVAFPFGKYDPATFACNPCDRFASDGSFTLWEFVSDNERRRSDALELSLAGKLTTGSVEHQLRGAVLRSKFRGRFGQQIFDIAGDGNIDGSTVTLRSSGFTDENTNRDESSTELSLHDAVRLSERTSLWLGLRHTRLQRSSVRTDGSRPTDYAQSFTTPWLALSREIVPGSIAYASWGRGVESDVTPNRPRYANAGQSLPALKSRQFELGLKSIGNDIDWGVAAFDIERPAFADIGSDCSNDTPGGTCTRQLDGNQRHRGIEASVRWRAGAWSLDGGMQLLRARRDGSSEPARNGQRPTNVAERSLRALAGYRLASLPGLNLQAALVHEGNRMALPDNSARIGGWSRVDAAARYEQRAADATLTWRLGIDNLADRRAWKEAPFQFEHVYLFPLPPRTWRLSLQADL